MNCNEIFNETVQKEEKQCSHCGKQYKSAKSVREHVRVVHEGKRVTCYICGATMKWEWNLKMHIYQVHKIGENPSKRKNLKKNCDQCHMSFSSHFKLNCHLQKVHDQLDIYKCKHCPKRFTHMAYTRLHMLTHPEEVNYQCTVCRQRYGRAWGLHEHIKKTNHKQTPGMSIDLSDLSCYLCEKEFPDYIRLNRHLNLANRVGCDQTDKDLQVLLDCKRCGQLFPTRHALVQHFSDTHGKGRRTSKKIKTDIITQIPKGKQECNICLKLFSADTNMKYHYDMHKGIKAFKCDICDYRTEFPSGIRVHKTHHEGDPKAMFYCKICNVPWKTQKLCTWHEDTHLDVPRPKCICGREFLSEHAYKSHQRCCQINLRRNKKQEEDNLLGADCEGHHQALVSEVGETKEGEAKKSTGTNEENVAEEAMQVKKKTDVEVLAENANSTKEPRIDKSTIGGNSDVQCYSEKVVSNLDEVMPYKGNGGSCSEQSGQTGYWVTVSHLYMCGVCSKEYSVRGLAKECEFMHSKCRVDSHQCSACGKRFYTDENFVIHLSLCKKWKMSEPSSSKRDEYFLLKLWPDKIIDMSGLFNDTNFEEDGEVDYESCVESSDEELDAASYESGDRIIDVTDIMLLQKPPRKNGKLSKAGQQSVAIPDIKLELNPTEDGSSVVKMEEEIFDLSSTDIVCINWQNDITSEDMVKIGNVRSSDTEETDGGSEHVEGVGQEGQDSLSEKEEKEMENFFDIIELLQHS